ncbi:DNA-dependent metalloprotease dvc-1 [Neocloeon triangulifer]|uniref:DNA-dependent metalloprotease dvc-1 n=1 Tax=Neocloeon triangulifer TaxID=2078957 RepID=UPI00286EC87A|nr:DNA-dependent metalloprotease dvc-1 [Neocloeon triangulifer]XP_059471818.1 DNA-dependent metalloprotease dvc-1 [Neocloeon triangulifer]
MSSIVSHEWELLDPCPDVHGMFIEFNHKFFWGKLDGVEVKWSPRMTLCAGVCSYEGRGGLCSIRLSAPLLKLRPRKDLVETLLHEMIHAYLFVTANNRDRDGHGPEFQKHMHRINGESGCKITIYHSFHAEVRVYQQHVWRCEGPCKTRRPFFGLVRRASNRVPGPRDLWWAEHQKTCGGTFIKIQEPEEFTKKKQLEAEKKERNNNKTNAKANGSKSGDIRKFINTTNSDKSKTSGAAVPSGAPTKKPSPVNGLNGPAASTSGANKVTRPVNGSGIAPTSNISGFGDFGSGSGARRGVGGGTATANRGGKTLVVTGKRKDDDQVANKVEKPMSNFVPFQGRGKTIGSASTSSGNVLQDRQKFLDRFKSSKKDENQPKKKLKTEKTDDNKDQIHCPVCNKSCAAADLNSHLEECLQNMSLEDSEVTKSTSEAEVIVLSDDEEDEKDLEQCPICLAYYNKDSLQRHIENCVQHLHDSFIELGDEEVVYEPTQMNKDQVDCPVCGTQVHKDSINEHLDTCLS